MRGKVNRLVPLAVLLAAALLCVELGSEVLWARITGTPPTSADVFCVGPNAAEVCVDASGRLVPTTDNNAALGTSSLRWSDLQAVTATLAGAATLNGNVTLGDAATDRITVSAPLALLSRTSTQINTLVPDTTGQALFSSTRNTVCVSSGVGTGAWVFMATSTVATPLACL